MKELFYGEGEKLGIGNTPLVPYEEDFDADIFIKNESLNASGSVKDRSALAMVLDAETRGILHPGDTIVEATKGNMGISLAYVGLKRGYKVLLAMPETESMDRRKTLQGLGAQLVLTEGQRGMQGALEYVEMISHQKGAVWLKQFENPSCVDAHYFTTGPEIVSQLTRVDVFVAGVGTGSTITGVARYLKEVNPSCQIVAIEPAASATISRGESGLHVIHGIGAGFVPPLYDATLVNDVQLVTDDDALDMFFTLNKVQGYSCGVSSAANIVVAMRYANNPDYRGKNIVTLFADGDDRYFSLLHKSIF